MSLQVYFGENLIDEQYYTGLTNNNELFYSCYYRTGKYGWNKNA